MSAVTKNNFHRVKKVLELFGVINISFNNSSLKFEATHNCIFNINQFAYIDYNNVINQFKIIIDSSLAYGTTYNNMNNRILQIQECANFIKIMEETVLQRNTRTDYTDAYGDIIYDGDVLEDINHKRQTEVFFDESEGENVWAMDDEYGGYTYLLKLECATNKIVYGKLKADVV